MLLCYYLFFTVSGSIRQDKIKSKSIGKQGIVNDLTCYILVFYSVLCKQFRGRFYVNCNAYMSHGIPDNTANRFFIDVACAKACNPAGICYLCHILTCRFSRTKVCHDGK